MTKLTLVIENDDGSCYESDLPLTLVVQAAPPIEPDPEPIPEPEPEPMTASLIPLSWDAPQFSGTATSGVVTIPSGGTLENKSITVHGEPASVVMRSGSTMRNVRIGQASREAVRIGGGTYLIEGCYLEAKGSGDDHADTIQAYAGPSGARLNLTVRNTLIRAHNTAATAGLFLSDNCNGPVTLENVIFQGGPFGLRLHSDVGGDIDLYMKDVFFVGPFGSAPFYFLNYGGRKVVFRQWDNVREATIEDGVLVPGELIPQP